MGSHKQMPAHTDIWMSQALFAGITGCTWLGWQLHHHESSSSISVVIIIIIIIIITDMLSAYFLIYLTIWLKQLFKFFGEILINLQILWNFCLCNIVLATYGLQKWQNRFGVDCKSSHFRVRATDEASIPFYIDRNNSKGQRIFSYRCFY